MELLILICVAAALITFFFLIVRCVSSIWSCFFGAPEYRGYTPSGPYGYTPCSMQKGIIPRYPVPQPQYATMPRRVIAIDTESVSGPGGVSMLARVSLVRRDGKYYDRYVKPMSPVTDYRTSYSGIREKDLENAEDFMQIRWNVGRHLEGCILVGHDLKHDLNALHLSHPAEDIRDTSEYEPFRKASYTFRPRSLPSGLIKMVREQIIKEEVRRKVMNGSRYDAFEMALWQVQAMTMADKLTKPKTKLKLLARRLLERDIQNGEHNSVEDAKAAMDLYLLVEMEWELAAAYND